MDQRIWQWTLSKDAVAPCFVRDVLAMRQHADKDLDFFWLGHTPCRTVLLFGMVVAVQTYDKRAIYSIDDGTAVIDCILRHPRPAASASKKAPLDQPPPPITSPGYPVRVVGKVVRHYESRQVHANTIDPCKSSLDEIRHLERVIELHKTKYSLAVPFVPPANPGAGVFSSPSAHPGTGPYSLPAPSGPVPLPLQDRNRPPSIPTHAPSAHQYPHVPSSPTASSIASSTPSSPCKPSSPAKAHVPAQKAKLRHPSRLHTRDLTSNTFRLYVKHYMDNAPLPSLISCPSPSRSTCGGLATPKKRVRDESDEPTPRPRLRLKSVDGYSIDNEEEEASKLGFTLSHLRRVPELALLAARVVRSEARRRDKADREKGRGCTASSASVSLSRPTHGTGLVQKSTPKTGTSGASDPPRKKIKRLFSWTVVKLYEEGSIVLWDGDVRPLPVPPPPVFEEDGSRDRTGLWSHGDSTTTTDFSRSCSLSASILYESSASASLYSHYHAPRQPSESDAIDADADPAYLSDPPADEEAYIPLTPRFLAVHVRDALIAMRRGRSGGYNNRNHGKSTPENVLAYMQRTDSRWARLGVWVVEEALGLLREI